MKKLIFRLGLLLIISVSGFFSCNKEDLETGKSGTEPVLQTDMQPSSQKELKESIQFPSTESIPSKIISKSKNGDYYYVDEKQEDFDKFDYDNITKYTGYTMNDDGTWNVWEFTTRSNYITWGKKNSFPVEKELRIREALTLFIETNNVIERFEKTGQIPKDYNRFQKRLFEKNGYMEHQRYFPVVLGNNCPYNPGSHWFVNTVLPVMPPGWNNNTSSWDRWGVYGGLAIFDKTFFRKFLGNVWSWGLHMQCLPSWANDKMSSCINLG